MTELTEKRCGYAVTDREGIEGPCDRAATSWRWYEDCGHEEVLEPACFWHENESGKKIHDLTARLARGEALAERIDAGEHLPLGLRTSMLIRAALTAPTPTEVQP